MASVRSALRSLARHPGFTVIAVLMLALGIGLCTATFSFANTFLLRDVPYPEPGRLVRIFRTSRQSANRPHAPANLLDLRDAATAFSQVAFFDDQTFALGEPGHAAEPVAGMEATTEIFDLLRVQPMLGRGFAAGEDAPDQGAVTVITQRAWQNRHGGDPGVIGRAIRLNGRTHVIIGVLPAGFDAPLLWGDVEYITPLTLGSEFRTARTTAWLSCVARLRPDVSWPQAQGELDIIAARLAQHHPRENADDGLRLATLHDSAMGEVPRRLLWLMTGVSLALLLITCANLASLQVARALVRSREYAVRAALGGSRAQLMAPLMLESVVLSVAGGLVGLLLASWTNGLFSRLLVISDVHRVSVVIDGRVFAFAGVTTLASALAFGLAPAWLASRLSTAEALKAGARSATPARSHQRLKHALIVAELALAMVLVGASTSFGVGARTFLRRDLGWQPDGLFAAYFTLAGQRYDDAGRRRRFHEQLLERVSAVPGVAHATLARKLPINALDSGLRTTRFMVEGGTPTEDGREPTAEVDAVSPGFFATLRIPLKEGSVFATTLQGDDPPVAIVNESLAARFWPGESAIGRRVRLVPEGPWLEIIGVVGDVRMALRLDRPETRLQLYRPLVQAPAQSTILAVRTIAPPATVASAVREIVAALDPDLPVADAGPLTAGIDRSFSKLNLVTVNLSISAGLGLLIATIGLAGVMSQLAIQRTRDIGVRIALGATSHRIRCLVIGEGARLLAASIAAGVPLFFALHLVLQRAMPEMPLPGWWLLGANVGVLTVSMLGAAWLPARRAARVDPIVALRAE